MSKILLVEDGLIIGFHIQKLLTEHGHEVVAHLTKGEEVFDHFNQLKPDLLVLDIMLKGEMTGLEAALQIREVSTVPIVFLSALTDYKTTNQATTISHSVRVSKPFEEDVFMKELSKLLA
ncbi:MAG: response regulator [Cyclobacteriaceae bacterium]